RAPPAPVIAAAGRRILRRRSRCQACRVSAMRFLLRKIGLYAFIAWAALTLTFLIPRLMPGDPGSILIAGSEGQIDAEARDAIAAQFGISDDPLPLQYVHYLGDLFRLDLGVSLSQYPVPVMDIISQSLPWTLGLVGVSTVLG